MTGRRTLLASLLMVAAPILVGPEAVATPLRNLASDQVVERIGYCKGEYTVTMANGARHSYKELNLRFKTDSSRDGPEVGKPALLPAGMRGDRAQVIFSGLDDLKRLLVVRCEGGTQ